jgi:uncharacterized protein (TIGR04255 family)
LPEQETYPHAPIVEAVLDIRVRVPFDALSELEKLHEGERETYPEIRHPYRVKFMLQKEETEPPMTEASHFPNGFVFVSADRLQVFQARPDGFSHNRLAPYIDWPSFRDEARRLWTKYRALARPEVIELLGLNYINRIHIPVGAEISNYLRTYVEVPNELPQMFQAQTFSIQTADPVTQASIVIAANFDPVTDPLNVPVTLNIQAFKQISKAAPDTSEESIWTVFEELRQLKNLAFESSITEKVKADFR